MDILLLLIGLAAILLGANFMTNGASALAKRMGLSDFIIGLTVVSMMTSAPELTVSVLSAVEGVPDMAIGNIVGSNIFNILVIVGVSAMVRPIVVERGILANDIPLVVLSSVVLLVMGAGPWLDGTPMILSRAYGIILLLFFVVFMRYTLASAKQKPQPATTDTPAVASLPLWRAILYLLVGLAGLIFGGQWFVDGATGIARSIGWSEGLIGLTILAAGTSAPELATSVMAAARGMTGICIGNVIGSCIFNIFFVLGLTATIIPMPFGNITMFDLTILVASSVLFWIVGAMFGKRTIARWEGVVMTLCYVAYIGYLIHQLPS